MMFWELFYGNLAAHCCGRHYQSPKPCTEFNEHMHIFKPATGPSSTMELWMKTMADKMNSQRVYGLILGSREAFC